MTAIQGDDASITWERTASRPETGLLIPSVNNSDSRNHCRDPEVSNFSGAKSEEGR